MVTKANLPIIFTDSEPAYFEYLQGKLEQIFPKIKHEVLDFDGEEGVHRAIFFTRKDKAYRDLMGIAEEADTPTEAASTDFIEEPEMLPDPEEPAEISASATLIVNG